MRCQYCYALNSALKSIGINLKKVVAKLEKLAVKTDNKLTETICKHIGVYRVKCYAFPYHRKSKRIFARLYISGAVSDKENFDFVMGILHHYVQYLKGGIDMEIKPGKLVDVRVQNGFVYLYDKRTGQAIAQLRYNPNISLMETMAFISAVVADYERYMKTIAKCYGV